MALGRTEQDKKNRQQIEIILSKSPSIFRSFYEWMDFHEKTTATMKEYIVHIYEFYYFVTNATENEKFYEIITESDIEKYMYFLRQPKLDDGKKLSDDARAQRWSIINTFFVFLCKKRYIEENPMQYVDRPKIRTEHKVTYLTQDEINSIFDKIVTESSKISKNRDMCLISLLLSTGLRISAVLNMNVEDIDFNTHVIKVVEKGNKTRLIPFSDNLESMLKKWLDDRRLLYKGMDSGPLFLSSKRKVRLDRKAVTYMINKYTNHLDKHITAHKFRSSVAMNLYQSGVGVMGIANVLGHENIATTQRYLTAFEQEKTHATNVLDSLLP